ncbi:MAG: hypothetical protein ACRD1H_12090, partial [Vicinamibacterales bacterium]
DSPSRVEVFAVDDDFYRRGVVLGSRPSDRVPIEVITLSPDVPPLTEADFLSRTADVVRGVPARRATE